MPHLFQLFQNVKTPKEAWDLLATKFSASTQARKFDLRQDLYGLVKGKFSISEFTSQISSLSDQLALIGVKVPEDYLIMIMMKGLGPEYKPFKTSISVRGTIPSYSELVPLLITEEKSLLSLNETSTSAQEGQALYTSHGRGKGKSSSRGRGGRHSFGRGNSQSQIPTSNSTSSTSSLRQSGYGNRGRGRGQGKGNTNLICHYCQIPGHQKIVTKGYVKRKIHLLTKILQNKIICSFPLCI